MRYRIEATGVAVEVTDDGLIHIVMDGVNVSIPKNLHFEIRYSRRRKTIEFRQHTIASLSNFLTDVDVELKPEESFQKLLSINEFRHAG